MNKPTNIKDVKECFIAFKEKDRFFPDLERTTIGKFKDGVYCTFEYKEDSFIVQEYISDGGSGWYVNRGEFFLKDYGKTWAFTEEELQ